MAAAAGLARGANLPAKIASAHAASALKVSGAGWLGFEAQGAKYSQKPIVPVTALSSLALVGFPVGSTDRCAISLESQMLPKTYSAVGDIFRPIITDHSVVIFISLRERMDA